MGSLRKLVKLGLLGGFATIVIFSLRLAPDVAGMVGAASAGVLIGASCLAVGSALGFLFGLPRTSIQDAAPDTMRSASGSPIAHQINTNLEQISDWLTKILVGLGLVNIATIGDRLRRLGHDLAGALGQPTEPAGEEFAMALIVFFLAFGFVTGYLWTRLDLAVAIRQADLSAVAGKLERSRERISNMVSEAKTLIQKGDADSVKLALGWSNAALEDDPNDVPALIQKGRALHRLGNTRDALDVVETALRIDPGDRFLRYNKACYLCSLGGYKKAEILENLGRAFEKGPFIKEHAKKDEDLKTLWDDEDFKALVDA